ncbi:tRNA (cytosine(72)-C(5))-methyltransferase NSUN6 isoform X3 [Lepidochelys kempii]|uniref:tRNA (cytosine(72)-C(5))-methyltransferase NSUN6 isoform X3 n=1 Tax=Lepidochelys kempii TaxID=8472 RepID=UPI003C6F9836
MPRTIESYSSVKTRAEKIPRFSRPSLFHLLCLSFARHPGGCRPAGSYSCDALRGGGGGHCSGNARAELSARGWPCARELSPGSHRGDSGGSWVHRSQPGAPFSCELGPSGALARSPTRPEAAGAARRASAAALRTRLSPRPFAGLTVSGRRMSAADQAQGRLGAEFSAVPRKRRAAAEGRLLHYKGKCLFFQKYYCNRKLKNTLGTCLEIRRYVIKLISALGTLEAERKYESLLNCLSHPPAFTTVRVNTHLASVKQVKNLLFEEIHKQFKGLSVPVLRHPELQDILLIPVIGPRKDLQKQSSEVIVGAQCGNSVLRGAHVFVPGIISASKFMKAGDVVSVYSDIEGKCKRGAKEFLGTKFFIGNGISELSRSEIFSSSGSLKGIGVRMTDPVYLSPSLDNVLSSYLFLQNLPSAVVSHVLNPQPGERILDMCAAPGGKTTHLATLMHDQGEVIAMDKIANKVKKIKQNAALLQLNCIKAFCCDGTKALAIGKREDGQEGPPFSAESFDRILLDVPCSGMGQRPNMAYSWTLKEVTSYQPLQRKLFSMFQQKMD